MNPNREGEILEIVDRVIAQGPFKPTWESLMEVQTPRWFCQKRLGIFLHWGIYSVPAFGNEWYSRNMYVRGQREFDHHVATYGPHKDFGYKDFIPMFRAEKFDAEEWMAMFREAGAGYVCPVAEHHDGFQMYDSDLSNWNAKQMGPQRDVLGELMTAANQEGMTFCASSHRVEHWFFMSHGREFESDIHEPMQKGDFYWPAMPEPADHHDLFHEPAPSEEFMNDWLARTAEIILKYRPKMLYFDWWIQHSAVKPYLKKLAAFYYNCGRQWGEEVIICYKHDAMMFGSGIVDVERGGFAQAKPYPWQTDTSVARNSWCHTQEMVYKSSREILWTLIDVVSKGGNLLLNFGPKSDGTLSGPDRQILKDLARWMAVNGEAIHGSRPWRKYEEGPTHMVEGQFQDRKEKHFTDRDYRFTVGNGAIYAICMVCPENGVFTVRSLGNTADVNLPEFHGIIKSVEILGYDGPLVWRKDREGLHVDSNVQSDLPVIIKAKVD